MGTVLPQTTPPISAALRRAECFNTQNGVELEISRLDRCDAIAREHLGRLTAADGSSPKRETRPLASDQQDVGHQKVHSTF